VLNELDGGAPGPGKAPLLKLPGGGGEKLLFGPGPPAALLGGNGGAPPGGPFGGKGGAPWRQR